MEISLDNQEKICECASRILGLGELMNKDSVEQLSEVGCNGISYELQDIGNTLMRIYSGE